MMAAKKLKIAFSGVFDLANYGDHLFPIVFKSMMEKRGLEAELYLFSPIACNEALNENKVPVYALSDLEKMHLKLHFDAIVVGGGEIIHFYNATQKLSPEDQNYENYPILETWSMPSLCAYKYNIPLIWNTPGAPFQFTEKCRHLVKALCGGVDYLSVRNPFSKKALMECGIPENRINLYPDSAFYISKIIDPSALNAIRKKVLGSADRYVVFHTNRFIPSDQIPTVMDSLNRLRERGYEIVLLPLAYTHGDDAILHEINNRAEDKFMEFHRTLSTMEMLSVLAGCSLYIGVSFHGAITALAYGKKAIAYDFMRYKKTEDLYRSLTMEPYYIYDAKDLNSSIERILNDDSVADLESIRQKLDVHFDRMAEILQNGGGKAKTVGEFAEEFVKGAVCFQSVDRLENSLTWHINKVHELNDALEGYQKSDAQKSAHVSELEKSLNWHVDKVKELNDALAGYQKSDAEKQRLIQRQSEKMKAMEQTISEMENSLSWRITGFLRKK